MNDNLDAVAVGKLRPLKPGENALSLFVFPLLAPSSETEISHDALPNIELELSGQEGNFVSHMRATSSRHFPFCAPGN